MYVTGIDAPIPRLDITAAIIIVVIGVVLLIAWLIFLLVGYIPH